MNRRQLMVGTVAVAVSIGAPVLPALAAPAIEAPLLSFIVGSDGESDWQWVRAIDKADAIAQWMIDNHGMDACEENADDPPEDCDCDYCRPACQLDTSRVKRWDDRTHKNPPTPAEWVRAGYAYQCECGADHAVSLGESGFICPDGVHVECEDCHDERVRNDEFRAEQADLERQERSGELANMATT